MNKCKNKDKKYGFIKGAGTLTVAAVAVKFLSVLYRIPLTEILGAVGLGTYQSAFPTYALIITLTGGGLTAAVSKCCAAYGNRQTVKAAVIYALIISVPLSVVTTALSGVIAALSGCEQAVWALAVLLPSVPLSAVTAAVRGGFIGSGHTTASSVGQITEQTVKIAAGLTLAFLLSKYGVAAAVAGAAAGVAIGESVHLLYCVIAYKRIARKGETTAVIGEPEHCVGEYSLPLAASQRLDAAAEIMPRSMITSAISENKTTGDFGEIKRIIKQLLKTALPITLGLTVLPLCRVLDSFTAVNVLVKSGVESNYATSLYGIVTGSVNAVVNMPSVLTAGISSLLIPKIAQSIHGCKKIGSTVIKTVVPTVLISTLCAAMAGVFSTLCMKIVCGNCGVDSVTLSRMLRYASISIPLISAVQILSAVLQGSGYAYLPALNLFVAGGVKQILDLILLPVWGIYGFITAEIAFYAVAAVADTVAVIVFIKRYEKKIRNPQCAIRN